MKQKTLKLNSQEVSAFFKTHKMREGQKIFDIDKKIIYKYENGVMNANPVMLQSEKASYDLVVTEAVRKDGALDENKIITANSTGNLQSTNITATGDSLTANSINANNSLFIPQMTATERDQSSLTDGAVVYDTTYKQIFYKTSSDWIPAGKARLTLSERKALSNPYNGMEVLEVEDSKERIFYYLNNYWCLTTPETSFNSPQALAMVGDPDDDNNASASAFFKGGLYRAPYDMIFNEATFVVNQVASLAKIKIAIYQDIDNTGISQLLGYIDDYDLGGVSERKSAQFNQEIHVQRGEFTIVWGRPITGAFRVKAWNSRTNPLNEDAKIGAIPSNFTSTIGVGTNPASTYDFRYKGQGQGLVIPAGDDDTAIVLQVF